MTVIGFKSKEDKNKDLIIKKLQACLALAKRGEIKTLVIAAVTEVGTVQCSWGGVWLDALGALRVAEKDILDPEEP